MLRRTPLVVKLMVRSDSVLRSSVALDNLRGLHRMAMCDALRSSLSN